MQRALHYMKRTVYNMKTVPYGKNESHNSLKRIPVWLLCRTIGRCLITAVERERERERRERERARKSEREREREREKEKERKECVFVCYVCVGVWLCVGERERGREREREREREKERERKREREPHWVRRWEGGRMPHTSRTKSNLERLGEKRKCLVWLGIRLKLSRIWNVCIVPIPSNPHYERMPHMHYTNLEGFWWKYN